VKKYIFKTPKNLDVKIEEVITIGSGSPEPTGIVRPG
jgi:hypothetical protein